MKINPKVSVVIPTYNRAHLIGRAIESVLNQTYQDFELIIIDDCSIDNTDDVIKEFQKKDNRIIYLKHDKNKGGSAARNTGIKTSRGEYIAFLDSDDEWLPEKLEKQINVFKKLSDNIGLVYSGYYEVLEQNGEVLSKIIPIFKGDIYKNILKSNILGSPTPLIRKICFEKAGLFDETLLSCQDWDLWIRIAKYYKFDFLKETLAKYYIHGNQISTNINNKILSREIILKKYYLDLLKNFQAIGFHYNHLGVLYSLDGEINKARKYFLNSIKFIPFKRSNYFHLLFSLLNPKIHKKIILKRRVRNIEGITIYY